MNIFNGLSLVGGLALFLLGMTLMGEALEKKAGGRLKTILGNLTSNPIKGFFLGLIVTAIIQSSSATTVMVVGFVSAGVMTLNQAVSIIIGANVGTTVTAWILSLTGISGSSLFIKMLKPSSFVPILAVIGIIFYLFSKNQKRNTTGMILLGFTVLMTGMDQMSSAVAGLKEVPEFTNMLIMFSNPIMGVLAGATLTAIIQSSSASVGILQALASTDAITYSVAIPIILGQNIGTCITALLASLDATKNAKRAAMVHLYFNILGSLLCLVLFYTLNYIFKFSFVGNNINELGIAVVHTAFNLVATLVLLPGRNLLVKLACATVKGEEDDKIIYIDENMLSIPSVAVGSCKTAVEKMASISLATLNGATDMLNKLNEKTVLEIRKAESEVDRYEDEIGEFIVKISSENLSDEDNLECTKLLRVIGDFERIADHAINILESAEEMSEKTVVFSKEAKSELSVLISAVKEITNITVSSFVTGSLESASQIEPLEEVIDELKERIKLNHILRLQKNECSIEHGFVLSDILNNLERIADHCSNIGICIIEMSTHNTILAHSFARDIKTKDEGYERLYGEYRRKYVLA